MSAFTKSLFMSISKRKLSSLQGGGGLYKIRTEHRNFLLVKEWLVSLISLKNSSTPGGCLYCKGPGLNLSSAKKSALID